MMSATNNSKSISYKKQVLQTLNQMVKEEKLATFIKKGKRYWINSEQLHECSICKKKEVCKEENCDFMNLLGCHSSCLAKQRLKGK